ncbi:MAG: GNAT family N-acetyltransferase [Planctomycetes bacterium]|nr:GNAT family N-acetyltransferase [Planctomycetota bacterium]
MATMERATFAQSWEWGKAKETAGWTAVRWLEGPFERPSAMAQGLARRLPGLGLGVLWVPRGPIAREEGSARMGGVLRAIRRWAARHACAIVWVSPYHAREPERDAALAAAGFRRSLLNEETVPGTFWLDLTREESELRARMSENWRRNLDRGVRAGLRVRSGTEAALVEEFLGLHGRMSRRKDLPERVGRELLLALVREGGDGRGARIFLVDGSAGGAIAGAAVLGAGGSCAYAWGGSLGPGEGGEAGAANRLHWEICRWARGVGYRRYDLEGADPRSPVYEFKRRMGGEAEPLTGIWEWSRFPACVAAGLLAARWLRDRRGTRGEA